MNAIVDYLGLDVHKETIAVSIAPQNSPARFCGGFSTALARMERHPLNPRSRALESAVAAAALPAQSKTLRAVRKPSVNALRLGLRWQVGRDTALGRTFQFAEMSRRAKRR